MVLTKNVPNELTSIGCGIVSISDRNVPNAARSVNFHANAIRKIDGLDSITLGQNLRLLDLSSNHIRDIENLDALVNLRFLNLAGNLISEIGPGLGNLRFLECLNLSFNQIVSLNGLRCFSGADSKLRALFLHGNKINELSRVLPFLRTLTNIKTLTFEIESATNPICRDPRYPSQVWTHAPRLTTLDGNDASGARHVSELTNISEEAELAGLLEFLTSDDEDLDDSADITSSSDPFRSNEDETVSSVSDTQSNIVRRNYPKIEAALNQFRSVGQPRDHGDTPVGYDPKDGDKETERIEKNDRDQLPVKESAVAAAEKVAEASRLANIEKQLRELLARESATAPVAEVAHEETQTNGGVDGNENIETMAKVEAAKNEKGKMTEKKNGNGSEENPVKETRGEKKKGEEKEKRRDKDDHVGDDDYMRNLLGQLDEEREKRWTMQQKYDDLSLNLNQVNEKRSQERKQIEEALTVVHRLQSRLESGKASQREMERNIDSLTDANEKLERDGKLSKQREVALQRLLREAEEKGNKRLKERDDRIAEMESRLDSTSQEARLASSEVDALRTREDQLKNLIAQKEKEHQESLKGKYSIGSTEIQTLLTKEGDRISDTYTMQVELWKNKYREIEDEFRLALHLEAERFANLQNVADKWQNENSQLNTALAELTGREARASGLVKELSNLAKEQKLKLASSKRRCELAESALSTAKERLKAMDELTTGKMTLQTKCASLETLVKSIKAEKELWSSELAQQGSALSQDRGRLEAKVEALTAEVTSLKKQMERDADSLRIKSKVIDDQTETIKKLKDGLLERDRRIKEANEEHLANMQESNRRLEEEIQNRRDAEERIEYLQGRKEELKSNLSATETELTTMKTTNEKIVAKWKERSKMIDDLETKVAEMKRSWDEKEETLKRERDVAVAEKEETRAKSAAIDAAFRTQLDGTQAAHVRALSELDAEKNREIDRVNLKLLAAEDEMREILKEAAEHKAEMKAKIERLTNAFADLQN